MGDYGDDGSQGSSNECIDRASDTDITGEEKQATDCSSSAVVEAKEETSESQVSEKKFLDRDVDPALLAKIVVGKIVGKGEEGDLNEASQNGGAMAELAQIGLQSKVTDISGTEKDASSEVDITLLGLDQFTSWEDSVVVGVTSDYSVEDVSLVLSVVSDPAAILAGNGSVFLKANDKIAVEGKVPSPPVDLDQASPFRSSLVSTALLSERDKALPDAYIRGLTAAEIWEIGGEDVDLQCVNSKFDTVEVPVKTVTAELKGSVSCGLQDGAPTPQFTQEIDSSGPVAPVVLFTEACQQDVGAAGASTSCSSMGKEDKLTTRLDSEEKDQELHASLVHDAGIVACEDVVAPAEASKGAGQEAFTASASVRAKGTASGTKMEKELGDEEHLVVREGGDSPLPIIVEDSKGTNEIQFDDILNHRKVSGGVKVGESSGSMVEAISVDETAPCDMGLSTPRHFLAVHAGDESISRPARVEVTVSLVEKMTGSNKAGSKADVRVDTSTSEDTMEDTEAGKEMSQPKASVRDDEGNDLVMGELVLEEPVSREEERDDIIMGELVLEEPVARDEERDDIVMEDVPNEESPGVNDASEGGLSMAEVSSSRVQVVTGKEPEFAKGLVEFETTTVETVDSVMNESELDIVKNLVRNLSREVSTKSEALSVERNTDTIESPNLVSAISSNATNSSSGPAAQKLEVPAVSGGFVKCEKESRKWKELILHGLKLLKSVATDIELKQKDTVSSVRGGTELVSSDELKGNEESLAETMQTRAGTKSEVAVDCLVGSEADHRIITIEGEERTALAGVSSNDEDRSLGRETLTDVKPSEEVCWSEEVKVLETPIISPQSPDKVQLIDGFKAGFLVDYAINQAEVAGSIINPTIAVDYEFEVHNSVVPEAFEGGAERKECKGCVDGSPALGTEKFETSVISETIGLISDLHVAIADEGVEVSGDNVDQCSNGSQHSSKDGQKVIMEEVKAASGESDCPSLDPQPGKCSLDTRIFVENGETPGENTEAAFRQDKYTIVDRSHSFLKSEVEEISQEGDRVPFDMQPMIRGEKVLAISTHDPLPVAKRTLPVVSNKEEAAAQTMETTFFTSHPLEDRKGPTSIKGASKIIAEYQEGEWETADGLAQQKSTGAGLSSRVRFSPDSCKEAGEHMFDGGLENWDRFGVVRATDVAQITHVDVPSQDGEDSIKTTGLKSTIPFESAEDPQQLMSNKEGCVMKIRVAVEADGRNPTVAVKRKLQTKRKKVTGETEKKPTEAASLEPVLCSSLRVEAATTQAAKAVVKEDVEMHGLEDVVRILDDTGASPIPRETSAGDQAVVVWSPEADGVEGSPTCLINGDETQTLDLMCNCGKPAVLKTVGYKSQNRGLRYYSCEKFKPTFFTRKRNRKRDNENLTSCRFFEWLDSPRVTIEDKKEIRLQKKRQLELILAAKAVTTNYSTRSSSKQELSEYDAHKNQGLLDGVPPVSGLSVEEPKHENSEEQEPSSKKQKLNKMDPSLSTADSVAFSTRASAARKREGPFVADTNDKSTPGNSCCGDESSHEVSVRDWTDSNPRKGAKRFKSEADTPAHTYSRRGESSRRKWSGYMPRAKNVGRLERATADTHHVRKLLPVALAYEKSREVVLEESSEEEVSGDQKEDSDEEENCVEVRSSSSEPLGTPSSTSAEREQTPAKSRSQRASSTPRSDQNGMHTKPSGKLENSRCNLQKVCRDASDSETSLSGDLERKTNQPPQWIDVPLTCPFENKDTSKSVVSGQQAVQHEVGQYGPFAGNHDLVVNFPTAFLSGERTTISSNTLLLVKKKAREASLAVNLRRRKSPTTEIESQRMAWTKPADRMKKRSERAHASDSDEEETGPSGSRGLRSLKDMLKRENSDGTIADYEVADESQPPYCDCKIVRRRAVLKTVLSNSANHGLRYWVCVNHRPLFQKKSLWEGDPNDESCKFFRWLDTPIISYAERKKQSAARRRRNERRRR